MNVEHDFRPKTIRRLQGRSPMWLKIILAKFIYHSLRIDSGPWYVISGPGVHTAKRFTRWRETCRNPYAYGRYDRPKICMDKQWTQDQIIQSIVERNRALDRL